jgi:signal transduction histidine kinase/ActR/RegA family two-component response regulator
MALVLLVSAQPDRFSPVVRALEGAGHHVIARATRDQRLREDPPAADLTIVQTSGDRAGGIDLCRRLRRTSDRFGQPVAPSPMLLLAADELSAETAEEAGVDDVIVEPATDIEIVARAGFLLRDRHLVSDRVVSSDTDPATTRVLEHTPALEDLAAELRAERDVLRETFNVIEEGLLLMDVEGTLVIENMAAARLRGAKQARGLGPAEPLGAVARLGREAIAKGDRCERTILFNERQLFVRAYPTGVRALIAIRDVTEERDIELRRLQSEKLASLGMLAAGVAHEINNPASFVLANLESVSVTLSRIEGSLGKRPGLAEEIGLDGLLLDASGVLQEAKEGMARIHRIVKDLNAFSRVDDDARAITDVHVAIESSLSMVRNQLSYSARVEKDLRARRPVAASLARLGQVFLNILVNAAHALSESGSQARNRVCIRTYDRDDDVVVEIEDNGPGIPPTVLPRVFESFFTTKPRGVGTGLGLPISRDIVRSQGGEITAESELGKGALFRVSLPAAAGAPRAITRSPEPGMRQRRRLLAIDDEVLLLKAYRRMLGHHHDIELQVGAVSALALLERDRAFDVILCDLQMPEMSGSELFHIVQANWPEVAERFIFITGGAFSPDAKRFLDQCAPACVTKPFQASDLLDLVERRAARSADARSPASHR